MKYLVLLFAFVGNLSAQITLQSNDIQLVSGDTIPRFVDSSAVLDVEATGEDVTWIFDSLNQDRLDVYIETLDDPQNRYPNATLMTSNTFNNFALSNTDSGILAHGFFGEIPTTGIFDTIVYDSPVLLQKAPTTFGAVINDTYTFSTELDEVPALLAQLNLTAIRADVSVTVKDTVDAWGTLRLPKAEFNCLRSVRTEILEVSAFGLTQAGVWTPFPVQNINVTLHRWFAAEEKFSVAEYYKVDGQDAVFYYTAMENLSNLNNYKTTALKSYPNPVVDVVYMDLPTNLEATGNEIAVYDFSGRKVLQANGTVANQKIELNVSQLKAGNYFIRILDDIGKTILHSKFIKY